VYSIAVVDDEEVIRRAMLRLLRGAGFQAEAYEHGDDFLTAAQTNPPDCVVTDLHMPKMTGMQLLLHVRTMSSPPPVLVMSGSGTPEERDECLASGAAGYLVKPVDHGVLLKAITAALKAPRQPS
jgi:CheY-like chemotaxis protein